MTAAHTAQIVCAVLFAVLCGFSLARWREVLGRALAAASAVTAIWAATAAAEASFAWPGPRGIAFLDTMRCAAWVLVLAVVYAEALEQASNRRRVRSIAAGIGLSALVLALFSAFFEDLPQPFSGPIGFDALIYGHLALATGGMMFIEALVYRSSPEALWRQKFIWLGIASILAFDLARLTEALIYGRFGPELGAAQATVFTLAGLVIGFAVWRHPYSSVEFTSGRRLIVQSAVLLSVGVLLVSIAAATAFLSATSGPESQLIRTTALAAILLTAFVLALSGRFRSFVSSRLRRILLAPRYDYRREWQRFTHNLSSLARGATLRERAQRAVADLVDSPRSSLWLRENGAFEQVMRVGRPVVQESLESDLAFFRRIEAAGWELVSLGDADGRGSSLPPIPDLLRQLSGAWLLVPLVHHERLMGFIILDQPRIPRRIAPEDVELLHTVSTQVASYIAEEQATRALSEASRFRELSQSVSFFAHDLRNLANDLSLLLANSRRHIDNPAFQADLVATMDETVAGMQRLLTRIADPDAGPRSANTPALVDLAELVARFGITRPLQGPELAVEIATNGPCLVSADVDPLQAILGHLIRNALDAVAPEGLVEVRLSAQGQNAVLEIADNGPGMSEEFLHERLHHPFQTTKSTGFGLGMYECRVVADSLGGSLSMESEIGRGTTARLCLPIAEPPSD